MKATDLSFPSLSGRREYAIGPDGVISFSTKEDPIHSRNLKAAPYATLALPVFSGAANPLHALRPGLTVVTGATSVGKSDFVRRLAGETAIIRINAVEPFDADDEVSGPWFDDVDSAIAAAIHIQRKDANVLPVIDSLRALLFETSGAALPGGVTGAVFTALTRLNNALASAGHTVLATVNPMTEDPDQQQQFFKRISSSVAACIRLDGRTGGAVPTFTGVITQRPLRNDLAFSYRPKTGAAALSQSKTQELFAFVQEAKAVPTPSLQSITALSKTI